MKYFLGAYVASPNQKDWDPALETAYYDELKALPQLRGLEHPFVGTLHPRDDAWFLSNVAPQWEFVFTCVPGIMNALAKDPQFGLASDSEAGRAAAMEFMGRARDAVHALNARLGRRAVRAIQLQTAPGRAKTTSSMASLQKSLTALVEWDWQGAELLIEHCDALSPTHEPSKGFLFLNEEIAAIRNVQTALPPGASRLGIVINWGRSVYETRTVEGAVDHIRAAREAGLLRGLMFSGVSDQPSDFGSWRDSHLPPRTGATVQWGEPSSWMTEEAMHAAIAACGDLSALSVLGVKIGIRPLTETIGRRLNYIRDSFAILDRGIK